MKKFTIIVCQMTLILLCVMMVNPLSAQNKKKELQNQIEALNKTIKTLEDENDSLRKAIPLTPTTPQQPTTAEPQTIQYVLSPSDSLLRRENDSLKKLISEQYYAIYYCGMALLFDKYDSDYINHYKNMLMMIPDNLYRSRTYGMWQEVKKMIMSSKVENIDLRNEVWDLVHKVPDDIFKQEDYKKIGEVLSNVEDNYAFYDPVQHVVELMKAVPDSVKKGYDGAYENLIKLLSNYQPASEELKKVLQNVVDSGDYSSLEQKIKKTSYYKNGYYTAIPYLKRIVDEAIQQVKTNGNRADLQKIIDQL